MLACTRASYVHEWILPVYAAERAPTRLDLCARYRHVGVSAAMQRVSMKEELVTRYFALLARAIGNRRRNGEVTNGASEMGSGNVCIYIRIYIYIHNTRGGRFERPSERDPDVIKILESLGSKVLISFQPPRVNIKYFTNHLNVLFRGEPRWRNILKGIWKVLIVDPLSKRFVCRCRVSV